MADDLFGTFLIVVAFSILFGVVVLILSKENDLLSDAKPLWLQIVVYGIGSACACAATILIIVAIGLLMAMAMGVS